MPTPHQPASLLFPATGLTPVARAAVTFALQPLKVPPGVPQGDQILAILDKASNTIAATFLAMTKEAAHLLAQIGTATAAMTECSGSTGGLKVQYEVWSVLGALQIDRIPADLLLVIGSEYLLALADGRHIRSSRAQFLRLAMKAVETRDAASLRRVARVAQAAVGRAAERFDRGIPEKDNERRQVLCTRLNLQWSRHVQFSSRRDIKLVRSGSDLHWEEVRICAEAILKGVRSNDVVALIVGLAFWVGLAIEDFLDVSISGEAWEPLSIDRLSATSRADLSTALGALAQADYPGGVDSSLVLIRSIPLVFNSAWVEACRAVPSAKSARDLLRGQTLRATDAVPGVPDEHADRLTVARLIAARSRPLIELHHPPTVIAFACLDLRRVQPSTYPYATVSAEALWAACEQRALVLGWGPIAPIGCRHAIGSRVTPREDQVTAVFEWLVKAIESHQPGRHCRLSKLIKFHNLYSKYVAAFLAFVAGLRESHPIPLLASMLRSTQVRSYTDKHVSQKALPWLILCPEARELLRLWFAHCKALGARLTTAAHAGNAPDWLSEATSHLERLQRLESVHLLFRITRTGVAPVRSRDWVRLLPRTLSVKADFGRHFWFDALLPAGASVSDAHSFIRHLAQEHELFLSTSSKGVDGWERRVSAAIQHTLERLGVRAAQGLSKR
jgi:hypothetical protein